MESIMKLYTMNSILVLVMNIVRMEHKEGFAKAALRAGVPEFMATESLCGAMPLEAMFFKRFCDGYGIEEAEVLAAAEHIRTTVYDKKEWSETDYYKDDILAVLLCAFRERPNYKDYAFLVNRKHVGLPFIQHFALSEGPVDHDMMHFARIFS